MNLNQGWTYCEQIKRSDAGQTVLSYYSQKYRHSSQSQWQARIIAGQILLNGKPATTTTILQCELPDIKSKIMMLASCFWQMPRISKPILGLLLPPEV